MARTGGGVQKADQYRKQTPTKPDSGWPEMRIQVCVQDTDGGSRGPPSLRPDRGAPGLQVQARARRNTNCEEKDARLLV